MCRNDDYCCSKTTNTSDSYNAQTRGVATGGGISVYIPPKAVHLNFIMGYFFLLALRQSIKRLRLVEAV